LSIIEENEKAPRLRKRPEIKEKMKERSFLHGPGSFLRIIPALRMKVDREYPTNPMATGNRTNPYTFDARPLSPKATTAREIVANVTDMFIHDKKVLSLAKKTFGSIFTGI
jgi:hypothetical protein